MICYNNINNREHTKRNYRNHDYNFVIPPHRLIENAIIASSEKCKIIRNV